MNTIESCCECGDSVAQGSGKFINRVPILDDLQTKHDNGRPFPEGEYICGDCDNMTECDSCGKDFSGDTYQDIEGQVFVCQDCFEKSNDGTFYVRVKEQKEIMLSGKLEALEALRQVYVNFQDDVKRSKEQHNDREAYTDISDGEWLDNFVEATGKLLEVLNHDDLMTEGEIEGKSILRLLYDKYIPASVPPERVAIVDDKGGEIIIDYSIRKSRIERRAVMPRVSTIKKARKDYPESGIKKGDTYYKWSFRYGSTHKSKAYPKQSQLTQSPFLSEYYSIMEELAEVTIDDIEEVVADAVSRAQQLGEECQESLDNMPEGLQEGEVGQILQERIDGMEEWATQLEEIDFEEIPIELTEDDIADLKEETDGEMTDDDIAEKLEDMRTERFEEIQLVIVECEPCL